MSDAVSNVSVAKILLALGIVIGFTWLARYLTRRGDEYAQRYIKYRTLFKNGSAVIRFVLYIIATFLAATTLFEFSKEALIASAGAIALTASFAFQDLGKSVIGGVTLLLDRPFQVGDRVQFQSHYGEITEIGLRTVRLQTLDDSTVSIPNNLFLTEAVSSGNAGALDMMVVVNFYVDPNSSVALAKALVHEAVVTSKYAFLAKPVVVLVFERIVGQIFCTHLVAKAYVFNIRFEKAFESDVTERVKEAFQRHGIRSAVAPMPTQLPVEVGA